LPPESNIVTMALRSSHGTPRRPPSRLGRPVPPPKQPTRRVRRRINARFYYHLGMAVLSLSADRREAFEALARDLRDIFGERLVALVAYGPGSSAAFTTTITVADLAAAARMADRWRRHDVAVPLLITPDEFRRSLDAFPI